MTAIGNRRWIRTSIAAVVIIGGGTAVGFNLDACLRRLSYNVTIRYGEQFGSAISGADRIVVRSGGFDCCGPVDNDKSLFTVTSAAEVADVAKHIAFVDRTTRDSMGEACMCCGDIGIDWYRGDTLVALTSLQHGHALRWRGFSSLRVLFVSVGYGDGPLTDSSADWLKNWLLTHGVGGAAPARL